jgi:hypothetical protein
LAPNTSGIILPWLIASSALVVPLILLTILPWKTEPNSFELNERGYGRKGKERFLWKGAVGWGWRGPNSEDLVLVGKGGRSVQLPAPLGAERSRLESYLSSRLSVLSPADIVSYTQPVIMSAGDVIGLSLTAYINALLAAWLAPTLLRLFSHPYLFLFALAVLCLPFSVLLCAVARSRYPQYRHLTIPLAIVGWFLTTSIMMPLCAAFVIRAFFPHPVAG